MLPIVIPAEAGAFCHHESLRVWERRKRVQQCIPRDGCLADEMAIFLADQGYGNEQKEVGV